MATCNKCQQCRGLKSEQGQQMDGQIEVDVLEKHLFIHWCHLFSLRRFLLSPIICGLFSILV